MKVNNYYPSVIICFNTIYNKLFLLNSSLIGLKRVKESFSYINAYTKTIKSPVKSNINMFMICSNDKYFVLLT